MKTMNAIKLDETLVRKVLTTVDAGLTRGKGHPQPGQMSVEAAVCFAYGLPHSDCPPCVGEAVRSFKISLNDSAWSSKEARTNGLRRLAIAQLDSQQIDQREFARRVALRCVQKIVPIGLRAAAKMVKAPHAANLEQAAKDCEAVTDLKAAEAAARTVTKIADAAYAAYAAYGAYAASYAASAAYACAAAYAANACAAADTTDATTAASYAASVAYAVKAEARDKVLQKMADIGLEVLIELKSPGCKWLWLCDEK